MFSVQVKRRLVSNLACIATPSLYPIHYGNLSSSMAVTL